MLKTLSKNDGFALILTMVMLAILSILGVMVLNTTNTELSITSNYRIQSDAFVDAEVLSEYAQSIVQENPLSISEGAAFKLEISDVKDFVSDGFSIKDEDTNVIVFYTGSTPSRMSETTSVNIDQTNLYQASTTGTTGNSAFYRITTDVQVRNRSSARTEKLVVNRGGQVF